jgi:lactoylglutathione lyase
MPVETMTSTNVKQAVPFFGVTNMEASLRFYVDGLGFKMTRWVSRKSSARMWRPEVGG